MSRIGRKIILLPEEVSVDVGDKLVVVKGPKGELSCSLPKGIKVVINGRELSVAIDPSINKGSPAMWGTSRALIAGMVKGVVAPYEKKLEIDGIGYKVQLQGNDLILNLGFSHQVIFKAPKGITFQVEKNVISVIGISNALVGEVAANIRKLKKPEPYKGKGIHYQGEIIRRKSGKKAIAAS